MTDLHDEFDAWIAGGARDELARDVAVHASGCDACLVQAAAFDALLQVDPDAAGEPPRRAAPIPRSVAAPLRVARAAAGAIAVTLVVGAGVIAGGSLFRPPPTERAASVLDPTPAEGVLAGEGGPSPTAAPTASPTPSPSPSGADATAPVAATTPRPTMGGGPPPISTAVPVPPPAPPSTSATPSPTAPPSMTPTPTPSPTPSPTPTPSSPPVTPDPSPSLTSTPTPTQSSSG